MGPAPAPFSVHLVTGGGSSPDLALLLRSLAAARVVALDAEWKPRRRGHAGPGDDPSQPLPPPTPPKFPTVTLLQVACHGDGVGGDVFVIDLLALPLADLWAPLRELFERPEVLKLGFRFKQDLLYLSATFAAALGCDTAFDRELQCSDWSCRPLSEGQIQYAASDAYYLLDIFDLFQQKIRTEDRGSS